MFSAWCKILALVGYRRVLLVEQSLDAPIPPVAARLPVNICLMREPEVDEYLDFRPDVDAADVRRRLEAGDLCFVARHQGRIVHAAWAVSGRVRIDFLARDFGLAPDEVYIDESHTLPSFRGLDIAAARSSHTRRYYQEAGYRRSLAIVFPENGPACRAVAKQGYRPLGTMGYWKLGPWRFEFFRAHRPGQPWAGDTQGSRTRRAQSESSGPSLR